MRRLYEEITGRLAEMAQIIARNLELDGELHPTFSAVGLHSKRAERAAKGTARKKKKKAPKIVFDDSEGIEMVCSSAGCGCYYYAEGICAPC